jgi:hypothetical protein
MSSWIEPKRRHKLFVQQLLRARRARHSVPPRRGQDRDRQARRQDRGRPKASLVGAQGWIPICEKRLPFEATISLLLLQGNPGVPGRSSSSERHAELVPLDRPLDEQGRAAGGVGARLVDVRACV